LTTLKVFARLPLIEMTPAEQIERHMITIRGDLHKEAKKISIERAVKMQRIGDEAFELWLAKNSKSPIKKAKTNGNSRTR
jgi:plasmid maintenance system antidote protein VapI